MSYARDQLISAINFENEESLKPLGVMLHDTGFLRYSKLTPDNYEYWWYEVEDIRKLNRKTYTYEWKDMIPTGKTNYLQKIAPMYKESTSAERILNDVLIYIEYLQDNENKLADEYLQSLTLKT